MNNPIFRTAVPTILVTACLSLTSFAQTLQVTNNLQLWLKADAGVTSAGGKVTAWADQSGKNNNAAQADESLAPSLVDNALNTKPVLRFDGVDDYLEVADSDSISISGDITSFFVVSFDDFATYRAVWAKTSANLPGPNDWYALPSSGIPRAYRGDGSTQNLGSVDGGTALRASTYLLVGFDMAGTKLTHYLGAQPTGSGQIAATLGDSDTPLRIGTRDDFVTRMKGDIAEILIYDAALSDTDRAAVVDYLAKKYNIQNLPPTATVKVAPAGPDVSVGETITVTATASDPDGSIARVQFLVNGSAFATATAPPFVARVTLESAGAYEFTARAFDDKDAQTTSTAITLNAGPASTPSLTVTSSLQLWLKADEGVTASATGAVSAWADKSGKGNNATQADETLAPLLVAGAVNSKPVLRFDGEDDYLDVADSDSVSIAGDITSLFVVKIDDFDNYRAVWAKTSVNLPAPNDWYTLPSSGIPRLYRGNGMASLGSADGGAALRAGAFELAGFTAAGTAVSHLLNGSVTATGSISALLGDLDTPLKIGSRDDLFTKMKGDIAEILIYNAALSDTDRKQAEIYLAGKYGLSLAIPTNTLPTVSLTLPANGASFSAPAAVTVEATAADSDGAIVRVDFLVNGAVVASDTSAPYSAVIQFPTGDQAAITAVAIDNLGGAKTSDPVAITVTTTVQIPLPAAANLKLWLSADKGVTATAGSVSAWEDQSGNLNNAAQADATLQPQLVDNAVNNKPVIHFDGEDDYLSVSNSPSVAIAGDITTFFVVSFDDFDTYRAVWAKTAVNQPAPNDWYALPSTGIPRAYRGNGTGANGSVDGTTALTAGVYLIAGFDMAGTTLHHYLNGESTGEGQLTTTIADAGKSLLIGTRDDLFTKMKGDIAEIVIYNAALSDADRSKVVSYLGTKYGIPVSAGPPQLAISRSGNNVTISWPPDVTGFTLESAAIVPSSTWQAVPGVANNSVTVPIGAGNTFYRLNKP